MKLQQSSATSNHIRNSRWKRTIPLFLLMLVLTACAVNEAPPAVVCESLNRGIYTMRLAGTIMVLATVMIVGGSLLGQKWLKTNAAYGVTILTLIISIVVLVQAPSITTTFLTAGGSTMPDIVALCSIS